MTISISLPLTIPHIIDEGAKKTEWYIDSLGNACVLLDDHHYTVFRITPFRTPEMVKRLVDIHNENLLIGMSDDEYNKSIQ